MQHMCKKCFGFAIVWRVCARWPAVTLIGGGAPCSLNNISCFCCCRTTDTLQTSQQQLLKPPPVEAPLQQARNDVSLNASHSAHTVPTSSGNPRNVSLNASHSGHATAPAGVGARNLSAQTSTLNVTAASHKPTPDTSHTGSSFRSSMRSLGTPRSGNVRQQRFLYSAIVVDLRLTHVFCIFIFTFVVC